MQRCGAKRCAPRRPRNRTSFSSIGRLLVSNQRRGRPGRYLRPMRLGIRTNGRPVRSHPLSRLNSSFETPNAGSVALGGAGVTVAASALLAFVARCTLHASGVRRLRRGRRESGTLRRRRRRNCNDGRDEDHESQGCRKTALAFRLSGQRHLRHNDKRGFAACLLLGEAGSFAVCFSAIGCAQRAAPIIAGCYHLPAIEPTIARVQLHHAGLTI